MSNIIPLNPLLGGLLKRADVGNGLRPMPKIQSLECSITLLDNQGRAAKGTLDPWGCPAFGTIAEQITPDELFARVACLALLNGTSEQILHNIISQESFIRATEYPAVNKRRPAE